MDIKSAINKSMSKPAHWDKNIKTLNELLSTVCNNVFHLEEVGNPEGNYIVYVETGKKYESYDNINAYGTYLVDVHVYTRVEYDPLIEALEKLFNDNSIPFELPEIKYGRSEGQMTVVYYLFKCEI